MKNIWLGIRATRLKPKIKIWLGKSITGGDEEYLGELESKSSYISDGRNYCVSPVAYPAVISFPQEIDETLYAMRISKALDYVKELRENYPFNGLPGILEKHPWCEFVIRESAF